MAWGGPGTLISPAGLWPSMLWVFHVSTTPAVSNPGAVLSTLLRRSYSKKQRVSSSVVAVSAEGRCLARAAAGGQLGAGAFESVPPDTALAPRPPSSPRARFAGRALPPVLGARACESTSFWGGSQAPLPPARNPQAALGFYCRSDRVTRDGPVAF